MNRSWWAKLVLLVVFVVTAIIYVVPTVANLDLEKTHWPFKQKINLGLDLQGGLYMVLGVDFNKVFRDVMERQAQGIQANLKAKGLDVSSVKIVREGFPADDPRIQVVVAAGVKTAEIKNTLKKEYWMLRLTGDQASSRSRSSNSSGERSSAYRPPSASICPCALFCSGDWTPFCDFSSMPTKRPPGKQAAMSGIPGLLLRTTPCEPFQRTIRPEKEFERKAYTFPMTSSIESRCNT